MWGFSESKMHLVRMSGLDSILRSALCTMHCMLESHQFRGFKLDLAFTAFSHNDSNSGLDGCVDSLPPEMHPNDSQNWLLANRLRRQRVYQHGFPGLSTLKNTGYRTTLNVIGLWSTYFSKSKLPHTVSCVFGCTVVLKQGTPML